MGEMELETDVTLSIRVAIRLRMGEAGPEVLGVKLKHCVATEPTADELMKLVRDCLGGE